MYVKAVASNFTLEKPLSELEYDNNDNEWLLTDDFSIVKFGATVDFIRNITVESNSKQWYTDNEKILMEEEKIKSEALSLTKCFN